MDKLTLIPNTQIDVAQSPVYQVKIKKVEKVEEFDFPQARKTWEALVDAGMDPGELVANGLNLGHGYQISETEMVAPIKSNDTAELLGETQTSAELLLGYKYSSTILEDTTIKLLTNSQENSLVLVGQDLTVASPRQQVKSINMTAIVKITTSQINSSSSEEQKKLE